MRVTITLDDNLLEQAGSVAGIKNKPALINVALKTLIERESAKRLATLGGSEPQLRPIPRR